MTTPWAKVLAEVNQALQTQGPFAVDGIRRQKIAAVTAITGRPLVIYATACTTPGKPIPSALLIIEPSDKLGFQEVTAKIDGPNLDVLIHSPGGIADAVASIVELLRERFTHIRFIVPFLAKSAATMLVLSGDEVLMTPAAELGPIDPQMPVVLPNGVVMFSPAYALKEQYERAQREVNANPGVLPGWVATLSHPSRLVECELAIKQAQELVEKWLVTYMFAGDPAGAQKAHDIAAYLSDHSRFLSHGYPIRLNDPGLSAAKIVRINTISQPLEDAIWELYCAIDHTFQINPAVKIFENNLTPPDLVARLLQVQIVQFPPPPAAPVPAPAPTAPAGAPVPATPVSRLGIPFHKLKPYFGSKLEETILAFRTSPRDASISPPKAGRALSPNPQ